MKKQAFNPFLPGWEYIPDGEPHIFGDRVYLYGSHDRFNGDDYCQNDYVCWSAPICDLSDWHFHGKIYDIKNDPFNKNGEFCGYAPDCCKGPDGRYYLYYALNNHLAMSVAVCDTPCGEFTFLGHMKTPDGRVYGTDEGDAYVFDPGIFVDDDGRIHLYMGFSPTDDMAELTSYLKRWRTDWCHHIELCDDMVTMKTEPLPIAPGKNVSAGTSFEGHAFFEAPSIRKFDNKYYFIYSSEHFHELCYAVGNSPEGPFEYKGRLVSNGDIGIDGGWNPLNHTGNNHGSLIKIHDKFYIFYHRHTNNTPYSRQACAEEIKMSDDGSFVQAEITSCGLNGKALMANGEYKAGIACNVRTDLSVMPYITQSGEDRECDDDQYVKDMTDGAYIGFKYFDLKGSELISVKIKSDSNGSIEIRDSLDGEPLCEIFVSECDTVAEFSSLEPLNAVGIRPLYFTYKGTGKCDFVSFAFLTERKTDGNS